LARRKFATAPPDVRAELLDFYSQPAAPYATKAKPKLWAQVQAQLQQLKSAPPAVLATSGNSTTSSGKLATVAVAGAPTNSQR
jgi:hypothetical protein